MSQLQGSKPFLEWLAGAGRQVSEAYVDDYLQDKFGDGEEYVEQPSGSDPVVDDAIAEREAVDLEKTLADQQTKLILFGVAGLLALGLLVSVLRR